MIPLTSGMKVARLGQSRCLKDGRVSNKGRSIDRTVLYNMLNRIIHLS
ncbi:MAG: hypothetical protein ACHQFZ_07045 [Acidimicrobiales bacterium]